MFGQNLPNGLIHDRSVHRPVAGLVAGGRRRSGFDSVIPHVPRDTATLRPGVHTGRGGRVWPDLGRPPIPTTTAAAMTSWWVRLTDHRSIPAPAARAAADPDRRTSHQPPAARYTSMSRHGGRGPAGVGP